MSDRITRSDTGLMSDANVRRVTVAYSSSSSSSAGAAPGSGAAKGLAEGAEEKRTRGMICSVSTYREIPARFD